MLKQRLLTVENAELLNDYYDDKRSIIIVSGHYNNWELAAIALNAQIKHKVVGIYTPLTNAFFEHQFSKSRTKLGTVLVSKYEVKKYFNEQQPEPVAVVFGTDQSPQHIRDNTYWTTFLNQETAVMYGSEKYAKEFEGISDVETDNIVMEAQKLAKGNEKLINSYYKKIKKASGSKAAAQFYHLENYFNSLTRTTILENIPVIGELD